MTQPDKIEQPAKPVREQALSRMPDRTPTMRRSVGGGLSFMPQTHGEVVEIAKLLATAGPGVPAAFRNQPGLCFMVVMDALHWGMLPTQVIRKAYVVNGMVAYEAQLIHALINTRAGLVDDLKIEYLGEGPTRQIRVTGTLDRGERTPREYLSPMVKDIKVKNSPLWVSDQDQQLHYFGVRNWTRKWTPETLMGVYTRDEIEAGEITEVDRITAIQHDVLDDDPIVDKDAPAPTANVGARLSYELEQKGTEDELRAVLMRYQPEIDMIGADEDGEKTKEALRDLFAAHLLRVRGQKPVEGVTKFSQSFRK
jgi:hypothetical protein